MTKLKTPGSCWQRWFPMGLIFSKIWPLLRQCKKMRFGATGRLESDDLEVYKMLPKSNDAGDEFERLWAKAAAEGKDPSIFSILFVMVRPYLIRSLCFQIVELTFLLLQPILLQQFLIIHEAYWQQPGGGCSEPDKLKCQEWFKYTVPVGFLLCTVIHGFFDLNATLTNMRGGLIIRSALISIVARQTSRLSSIGLTQTQIGTINNMVSIDAQQPFETSWGWNFLWSAPLQIIIILILLELIIGPSFLAALGVIILIVPIMALVSKKVYQLRIKRLEIADNRIGKSNELFSGMKIVKSYGWEQAFLDIILDVLALEMKLLKTFGVARALVIAFIMAIPTFMSVATFSVYAGIGNDLEAAPVFSSIALLGLLRMPVAFLPFVIVLLINAIALKKK